MIKNITTRRNILLTLGLTLALTALTFSEPVAAANEFGFLIDFAYLVFGWLRNLGIALTVITMAVGLVKMQLTGHKTDDKGVGVLAHKNALDLVKNGVITLLLLLLIGPIVSLVAGVAGSVSASTCNAGNNGIGTSATSPAYVNTVKTQCTQ